MLAGYLTDLLVDVKWMFRVGLVAVNWRFSGWVLACLLSSVYSLSGDLHVLVVGFLHGFLLVSQSLVNWKN